MHKELGIICSVMGLTVLAASPNKAQQPTGAPPRPGLEGVVQTKFIRTLGWRWHPPARFPTFPTFNTNHGVNGPNRRVEVPQYTAAQGDFDEPTIYWYGKEYLNNPNTANDESKMNPHANSPGSYFGISATGPFFYITSDGVTAAQGGTATESGIVWTTFVGDPTKPYKPGWIMTLRVTESYNAVPGKSPQGVWDYWINTGPTTRVPEKNLGTIHLSYSVQPDDGKVILQTTSSKWGVKQLGPTTVLWPTVNNVPWQLPWHRAASLPNIDNTRMAVRRVLCISQGETAGTQYGTSGHESVIAFDGSYALGLHVANAQVAQLTRTILGLPIQTSWTDWPSTSQSTLLPDNRKRGYRWPVDFAPRDNYETQPRNKKTGAYTMTGYIHETVNIDLRPLPGKAKAHKK